MIKAAIYTRVSTDDQTTQNQIPVLTGWASQLRMDFVNPNPEPMEISEIYTENESAWKEGHQRELARLMSDAARGKFKVLIIWALDRLTRQGIRAQFEIMGKLAKFRVMVYSYQELWTLTPSKVEYDLLLSITAYIAQSESKRRSERTKAGIERKKQSGWKPGRPKGAKDDPRIKRHRRSKV
jgi:putative DNA-invertase from lambdoid prophage Rac